jgi:hypothetical protein
MPLTQEDPLQHEDLSRLKIERKRQSEKQRRSDMTSAFDELAVLVAKLEKDEKEASAEHGLDQEDPANDPGCMTRLDLISQAIVTLRRLEQDNFALKQNLIHRGDKVRLPSKPKYGLLHGSHNCSRKGCGDSSSSGSRS